MLLCTLLLIATHTAASAPHPRKAHHKAVLLPEEAETAHEEHNLERAYDCAAQEATCCSHLSNAGDCSDVPDDVECGQYRFAYDGGFRRCRTTMWSHCGTRGKGWRSRDCTGSTWEVEARVTANPVFDHTDDHYRKNPWDTLNDFAEALWPEYLLHGGYFEGRVTIDPRDAGNPGMIVFSGDTDQFCRPLFMAVEGLEAATNFLHRGVLRPLKQGKDGGDEAYAVLVNAFKLHLSGTDQGTLVATDYDAEMLTWNHVLTDLEKAKLTAGHLYMLLKAFSDHATLGPTAAQTFVDRLSGILQALAQ